MRAATVSDVAPAPRRRGKVMALLAANLGNQGVTAVLQILTLPALLTHWSLETAGVWLLLNGYASILTLADWGLSAVAMNRVATLQAGGEERLAPRILGSAFAVVTVLVLAGLTIGNAIAAALARVDIVPVDHLLPFALLTLYFGLQSFGSLLEAPFRALDRTPEAVFLGTVARVVEWAFGIGALFVVPSLTSVALGFAAGKTLTFVAFLAYVRVRLGAFPLSFGLTEPGEMRRLVRPALAYLHFPVGNLLSIQATAIVVGHLLGPAFLTVYSAYRTLSRLVVQIFTSASYSVWPEFNRLQGQRRHAELERVYRATMRWVGAASTLVALLMPIAATLFVPIWSRGAFGLDAVLFGMLMVAAWTSSQAQVPNVLVVSFSRHGVLARWFLAASFLNVALAYLLGVRGGGTGVAVAAIAAEAVVLWVSLREARRCLNLHPAATR